MIGETSRHSSEQRKRHFIKGLLPHIAPLVTMQAPGTLAAALELAQAYEEGLDMVNEVEPRKQKKKKKVYESSDEEEEEEEEEKKPKKTTTKKKEKSKEGHISWDCPDHKDNSNNAVHAKLIEVEEESGKEEDKLLQHLLNTYDAYLGKCERDDSSDENVIIKRPCERKEPNTPEPKQNLNTFGLPKTNNVPVPKVIKTEITPKRKSKKKEVIKIVKGNKKKKKENSIQPTL
ncbi:hypothetical protein Glove_230g180 [Diversispora epigaea]|uniref:Uncharacterized protein n=1 Tax=Diversispora epigaea TaxID=1348612 RepID=A0A397ID12_9GLOM|nr:hypothetical protein Glove_230g180 [Diversispora epigaea]